MTYGEFQKKKKKKMYDMDSTISQNHVTVSGTFYLVFDFLMHVSPRPSDLPGIIYYTELLLVL